MLSFNFHDVKGMADLWHVCSLEVLLKYLTVKFDGIDSDRSGFLCKVHKLSRRNAGRHNYHTKSFPVLLKNTPPIPNGEASDAPNHVGGLGNNSIKFLGFRALFYIFETISE